MSYWKGKGKFHSEYLKLKALIPWRGAVDLPCLERLRVAINAYYDLHTNGGKNMPQVCAKLFDPVDSKAKPNQGFNAMRQRRMRVNADLIMDGIIMAATNEQKRKSNRQVYIEATRRE